MGLVDTQDFLVASVSGSGSNTSVTWRTVLCIQLCADGTLHKGQGDYKAAAFAKCGQLEGTGGMQEGLLDRF